MLIGILIVWSVAVFGAYAACIINGIEPIFYLWLVFAIIGGIFLCMDGFDFFKGAPSKNGPVQVSIEHAKQGVKNKREEAKQGGFISDLLSYMTVPLLICLFFEYFIF